MSDLADLNDSLFAQLDRLGDDTISNEQLEKEINRSKAIIGVSNQVVSNATLVLEATKLRAEHTRLKAEDIPAIFFPPKLLASQ